MRIYQLDPLRDPRWTPFVDGHPCAAVFHTAGWLEALRRTYGYEPVVFTTSAPETALENGIAFCEVRSWLTGRRLVSLPFSDHCDPLVQDAGQLTELCAGVAAERVAAGWRHIEIRPRQQALLPGNAGQSLQYCAHVLDLRPDDEQLFRSFHRNSVQRKIRRAAREGLINTEGRNEELLQTFYRLLLITRKRHRVPPQPFDWFRNLAACLGPALTVRIASRHGQPIAGILTLRHRDTMVYKYGGSDAAFHQAGGMQFLFWKMIQAARAQGCVALDFGRSDLTQRGLIAFKERWGATRSDLTYWRWPSRRVGESRLRSYLASRTRQAFDYVPDRYRAAAGRILYRHVG